MCTVSVAFYSQLQLRLAYDKEFFLFSRSWNLQHRICCNCQFQNSSAFIYPLCNLYTVKERIHKSWCVLVCWHVCLLWYLGMPVPLTTWTQTNCSCFLKLNKEYVSTLLFELYVDVCYSVSCCPLPTVVTVVYCNISGPNIWICSTSILEPGGFTSMLQICIWW